MVSPAQTMILVKIITDAKDHITGPVKPSGPFIIAMSPSIMSST